MSSIELGAITRAIIIKLLNNAKSRKLIYNLNFNSSSISSTIHQQIFAKCRKRTIIVWLMLKDILVLDIEKYQTRLVWAILFDFTNPSNIFIIENKNHHIQFFFIKNEQYRSFIVCLSLSLLYDGIFLFGPNAQHFTIYTE